MTFPVFSFSRVSLLFFSHHLPPSVCESSTHILTHPPPPHCLPAPPLVWRRSCPQLRLLLLTNVMMCSETPPLPCLHPSRLIKKPSGEMSPSYPPLDTGHCLLNAEKATCTCAGMSPCASAHILHFINTKQYILKPTEKVGMISIFVMT